MDDNSRLEKLISQCRSADVDSRVDAVAKLQAEFESGIEIKDPDAILNVLKACLRTPNQHLTTATLSALPPLLPLLINHPTINNGPSTAPSTSTSTSSAQSSAVDSAMLRHIINAFLPAGGVVDRLGDNREKARENARETLVVLGGLAFRAGSGSTISTKARDGKGVETPLILFERYIREGGLASKVWRTKEQAILTLVHIRRAHHLFPIRPYLSPLVDALEDTDAHVRDCARQSVIELFTTPGVTDAARADLKKEMTKKNVRKTIVDAILARLVGGAGAGSNPQSETEESGEALAGKKEYVPPSLALQGWRPTAGASTNGTAPKTITRTASHGSGLGDASRPASRAAMESPPAPANDNVDIKPVYITSSKDLENEFSDMQKPFEGKETEHNWAARERAILRVRGMIKGDVHSRYTDTFLACLKDGFIQWSLKALASLRTTVSANTCSLYGELAIALGPALDPFCETILTPLLRMAGFTKKIAAQQSQQAVTTIIGQTSAQPRVILPLLANTLGEKTVQARASVVSHIKQFLEVHGQRAKYSIESSGGLDHLDKSVRRALADPNPAVRESARVCFWVFEQIWRDRGRLIAESLDAVARKQLEKACPNPEAAIAVLPPTTPKNSKKSSVAAAIAASRAKAKAIATAPPTLRHQATSSSHAAARATSPPQMRLAGSPSAVRPSSPLSRSPGSPPSPRSRILPNGMARSVSHSAALSTQSRSPPRASSPPSDYQGSPHRRLPSAFSTSSPVRASSPRSAVEPSSPSWLASATSTPTPYPRIPSEPHRQSTEFDMDGNGDSLLLATTIPIPDDSDSDFEEQDNLMSFSAPFEMYPPTTTPRFNGSKPATAMSNALSSSNLSTGSNDSAQQNPPEDALRARAEQAESAAERLLELVDPEQRAEPTLITSALLVDTASTPIPKPKPTPVAILPVTPASQILQRALDFKDSPAPNGKLSSLLDVLMSRKNESVWWSKLMAVVQDATSRTARETVSRVQELQAYIAALERGDADVTLLKNLAVICIENPVKEPTSPLSNGLSFPGSPSPFTSSSSSLPSLDQQLWTQDKNFDRLLNALISFLSPAQGEEEIEYALILLWQMLENQGDFMDGREGDIFSLLLRIRYCNKVSVFEATNTLRDSLTTRLEPVYGLTTMHASLRAFHQAPPPPPASADSRSMTYAFGLIALGKFILRLPDEILEEELPRLRGTLISALNDMTSLVVRESAAASIIAAQLVLRDETHLFALLDGLADEKKNLLTYLFDKHGARAQAAASGPSGTQKLEKEMRRLDARNNTPPRPSLQSGATVG